MTARPPESTTPAPSLWKRVAGLLLIVVITIGIMLYRDRLDEFAAFGYIGAFLAMLLSNATLILPAPGLIVVFALGSTLNPLFVGIAGALGATLGEITGYVAGYSGIGIVESSRITVRIHRWMSQNGPLTIFTLSAIPNPFFDLAGLFAGAGRMPLFQFLGATLAGKSVQAVLIAVAGMLSIDWVETLLVH